MDAIPACRTFNIINLKVATMLAGLPLHVYSVLNGGGSEARHERTGHTRADAEHGYPDG